PGNRLPARACTPRRSPGPLRQAESCLGVERASRVRRLASGSGPAERTSVSRRKPSQALLPVGTRGLGAVLRPDRAASLGGSAALGAARAPPAHRRAARVACKGVRAGLSRGRGCIPPARPHAVRAADRGIARVGAPLGGSELVMMLEAVLHD